MARNSLKTAQLRSSRGTAHRMRVRRSSLASSAESCPSARRSAGERGPGSQRRARLRNYPQRR